MRWKSVQSFNPCLAGRQACQSPPEWRSRAVVIQTMYDIVEAPGVESKVDEGKPDSFGKNQAITFKIELYV